MRITLMIAFATWRFGDSEFRRRLKNPPSLLNSKTPSSESKYVKSKGKVETMMKKRLFLACLVGALAVTAADVPHVVRQNWPWDAKVIIDVTMPAGTNDVEITASFDNGGAHHELVLTDANGLSRSTYCLTGGVQRFTWDPASQGYRGALTSLDVTAKAFTPDERAWLVIDVVTGASEFVALGDEPKDANGKPWQDAQYKTSKMVFRRIPAGTFTRGYTTDEKNYIKGLDQELGATSSSRMLTAAETTLTSDFYITIYQTTRAQVARIMDVSSSNGYYSQVTPDAGQMFAAGHVCFQRGSNSVEGINWPLTKFAVTPTSIIGRFRARCGNRFWIDLPTCAQWQRAARPDTKWLFYDTSSYPGGMSGGEVGDSLDTITNIIARISFGYQRKYGSAGGVYSPPSTVGALLPNAYGLYDLIGSRQDLLLDQWDSSEAAVASAGVDPVGLADANRNGRMVNNSFSNYGTISNWSIAFAGSLNSDNPQNSSVENCYRYVIHLNPPQSFGGKWVNDAE